MTIRNQIPSRPPKPGANASTFPQPRQRQSHTALYRLLGVLVIAAIVGIAGLAVNARAQGEAYAHTARVNACTWYYGRYSTEWQNCVDTP